ncbi:hypothetical protein K432DRAFT_429735 [Lepidopterella palustris CBS 459.81]|uniref:Uncharacterized protein n=1 Tax=Lepidopterella palustris CBS 459.81 TaxID=1314670 RepID=A0A8E2JA23_9PEZI|nr:hypothetical protein K432DRAFT_429735 [Lepidopterella palustris CBS 459.81]
MPVGDSRIRPNNVETQLKDSQVEIVLKNYDLVVETILSMRDVVHGQEPDRQPFHAPGKAIVRSYIKQYYLDEWSNILQFRLMNLPAEAHNHIYKVALVVDQPFDFWLILLIEDAKNGSSKVEHGTVHESTRSKSMSIYSDRQSKFNMRQSRFFMDPVQSKISYIVDENFTAVNVEEHSRSGPPTASAEEFSESTSPAGTPASSAADNSEPTPSFDSAEEDSESTPSANIAEEDSESASLSNRSSPLVSTFLGA